MKPSEFRGKRLDNGEWAFGTYTNAYGDWINEFAPYGPKMYGNEIVEDAGEHYAENEVDRETVTGFTGITDINENKLYDQDICEDENGNRFLVMWSMYFNAWCYIEYLGDLREYPLYKFIGTYRKVGNKFDNPELLEIEVAE
ncbi:YopX family protein [Listeria rustica]|uniref:YopX protein domain-containing protein n=1 Tax=Listeria rustica TaxID=2713503 RepID=A0A7W1YGA3_9LIST|nr:YopX family protein [Listeria rustica]MBA3926565.1 hypothetical protein [Listeria rustica]